MRLRMIVIDGYRYGASLADERCSQCGSPLVNVQDVAGDGTYEVIGAICAHPCCSTSDYVKLERES